MERNLSKKEIDRVIANGNTIWGIEGLAPLSEKEEDVARKFLAGEISQEEFRIAFLKAAGLEL